MAMFTFNGSQEMAYPNIVSDGEVLLAVPGQAYDLDSAPDANWSAVSAPAPQSAPAAPVAPAPEEPAEEVSPTPTTSN
jgi:hypothetical protein